MNVAENASYENEAKVIKAAILRSQAAAVRDVNARQLALYYAVGGYVSDNTRRGYWGTGAIDAISGQLKKDLPGLRGFSATNLKYMRLFFEAWNDASPALPSTSVKPSEASDDLEATGMMVTRQKLLTNVNELPTDGFLSISFSHHIAILSMVKDRAARLFYIQQAAERQLSIELLKRSIREDDYHHQGAMPNNFAETMPSENQAYKAIRMFKDEYLLDYINVEELGARDEDVDERMLEQGIIRNIRDFILKFGRDFAFIGNQYRIEAFGEEQFIDLLFFNRELNALVAVELKTGPFKTAYLGQLNGYLSLLDGFVKKPHENPSIGIVLCKDANKSFVDYVIRDYSKPLGVATYKTSKDMPNELMEALPPIEDLRALLDKKES